MDSALNVQDPEGNYIREFVPELSKMPKEYIYTPWTAPLEVQKAAKCIIGKDYPRPVVDHAKVSAENIARFKRALSETKATGAKGSSGASSRSAKRPRKA